MSELDPRWEIAVHDVKTMLDRGEVLLLDVREPREHQHCHIPGAQLIPMNDLPHRADEIAALAKSRTVVCHCHHGGRSLRAAQFLHGAGIAEVKSMAGGIDAWSEQIDPSVPRY